MINKIKSLKFIAVAFLTGATMQFGMDLTHDLYLKIKANKKKEKKLLFRKLRKAK